MSDFTLTKTRLFEGTWEGVLSSSGTAAAPPNIEVTHLEQRISGVRVIEKKPDETWALHIPIPIEAVADGVQTFLIRDASTQETLDVISLISGEVLADDIRAEMDLLRAELDMLKRAFRRHCVETM